MTCCVLFVCRNFVIKKPQQLGNNFVREAESYKLETTLSSFLHIMTRAAGLMVDLASESRYDFPGVDHEGCQTVRLRKGIVFQVKLRECLGQPHNCHVQKLCLK